jgi:signal peptidase I
LFKGLAKVLAFGIIVFAGAALLNAFVFQTYYVNGHSMQPTLHDSDRLIVNKVSVTRAAIGGGSFVPERGDIVVLSSQVSQFTAARNEQIIKRVIGLPGERITIERGTVTVYPSDSGQGIKVDNELGLQLAPTYSNQPIDVSVPEDSIFVLGDNRDAGNSYDSRDFGPVSLSLIEGTLWVRVLPLSDMRVF